MADAGTPGIYGITSRGTNIDVVGCHVSGVGTYGIRCYQVGGRVSGNYTNAAIRLEVGCTGVEIFDNDITAGGISDAGATTPRIWNNDGWVTENQGAAAGVADGGTIAHGCAATPTVVTVAGSVAAEMVTVTGIGAANITVAIKDDAGNAGTSQTVYWRASL